MRAEQSQATDDALQTGPIAEADNIILLAKQPVVTNDNPDEEAPAAAGSQDQDHHELLNPEKSDLQSHPSAVTPPESQPATMSDATAVLGQAAADAGSASISSQSSSQFSTSNPHAGNAQVANTGFNVLPGISHDIPQDAAAPSGPLNQQESFASNTTPPRVMPAQKTQTMTTMMKVPMQQQLPSMSSHCLTSKRLSNFQRCMLAGSQKILPVVKKRQVALCRT